MKTRVVQIKITLSLASWGWVLSTACSW